MKRSYVFALCALFCLSSGAPAMAGTWSWHSDVIEKILDIIRDNTNSDGGRKAQTESVRQVTPGHQVAPHAAGRR